VVQINKQHDKSDELQVSLNLLLGDFMYLCPVCKKDMENKEPRAKIKNFLVKHGCTENMCNPGGREFHFPELGRIQISDYCPHCDLEKLESMTVDQNIYEDLARDCEEGICTMCKSKLPGGDTPWSICFDKEYKRNCWGGDSHEYRGILCQDCAVRILTT